MSKTAPAILVPESDRGGRGAEVERGRNAMERDGWDLEPWMSRRKNRKERW